MSDVAAPAYELRKVSFTYSAHGRSGPVDVLHEVDLSVGQGRMVTIIGPNGSGKTTLLRCMTGGLRPDSGEVLLDGQPLGRYRARDLARNVGYVPQETMPAFDFSVLQVVLMGRSPYLGRFGFESAGDIEIAQDCLRVTDTLQFRERGFDELSSGERQRVVIARALAQQPRVMLLDEPTSFLDIGHQMQIYELLRGLADGGMTVICVSHDLNVAAQFADEMVLLQEGRVVADGPADLVMTAEAIESVYRQAVDVIAHPRTGRPIVLPREKAE